MQDFLRACDTSVEEANTKNLATLMSMPPVSLLQRANANYDGAWFNVKRTPLPDSGWPSDHIAAGSAAPSRLALISAGVGATAIGVAERYRRARACIVKSATVAAWPRSASPKRPR